MANSKIDIKTVANKVENEASKNQAEELAKLKKARQEASAKAKQKQAEAAKAAAEKAAKAASSASKSSKNADELYDLASTALKNANKASKKASKSSFKSSLVSLIIGVMIGFVLATVLGLGNVSTLLSDKINDGKENVDEIIDEHFTGYTALDFQNVILGKVVEHQELIVMEQYVNVETTITKAGLGNLEIFSKLKNVTYSGKGQYTVDLSKIDKDHINVDMDNKKVYITIPHAKLQEVILDLNNIEFEDTEKGFLAFGDLSLTAEQQNEIEKSVKQTMTETLDTKELYEQADEYALNQTWSIFAPLVSSVSDEFEVEMVFE